MHRDRMVCGRLVYASIKTTSFRRRSYLTRTKDQRLRNLVSLEEPIGYTTGRPAGYAVCTRESRWESKRMTKVQIVVQYTRFSIHRQLPHLLATPSLPRLPPKHPQAKTRRISRAVA